MDFRILDVNGGLEEKPEQNFDEVYRHFDVSFILTTDLFEKKIIATDVWWTFLYKYTKAPYV